MVSHGIDDDKLYLVLTTLIKMNIFRPKLNSYCLDLSDYRILAEESFTILYSYYLDLSDYRILAEESFTKFAPVFRIGKWCTTSDCSPRLVSDSSTHFKCVTLSDTSLTVLVHKSM